MSLKLRIDLLFGLLLLFGLAADIGRMTFAARDRVQAEAEATSRMARDFALAALANLQGAPEAPAKFQALIAGLESQRHVRIAFSPDGQAAAAATLAPDVARLKAPLWFYGLIGPQQSATVLPAVFDGKKSGELVIAGDAADEVNEVWQDVGALALTGGAMALAALLGASLILGRTLRPLDEYGQALGRLRDGDYAVRATPQGSPEFVDLCGNLNALAEALQKLSADNRALILRLMQAQEDERRAIAHDLHDEIGPHLFALRAQAAMLRAGLPADETALGSHAEAICAGVETLQDRNRDILRRLRPTALDELGLGPALRALVDRWREAESSVEVTLRVEDPFAGLAPERDLAIYRLVQEALTNIYRHSGARHAQIEISRDGDGVALRIEDDGRGFSPTSSPASASPA